MSRLGSFLKRLASTLNPWSYNAEAALIDQENRRNAYRLRQHGDGGFDSRYVGGGF